MQEARLARPSKKNRSPIHSVQRSDQGLATYMLHRYAWRTVYPGRHRVCADGSFPILAELLVVVEVLKRWHGERPPYMSVSLTGALL